MLSKIYLIFVKLGFGKRLPKLKGDRVGLAGQSLLGPKPGPGPAAQTWPSLPKTRALTKKILRDSS
jgi:hypothetical protein